METHASISGGKYEETAARGPVYIFLIINISEKWLQRCPKYSCFNSMCFFDLPFELNSI